MIQLAVPCVCSATKARLLSEFKAVLMWQCEHATEAVEEAAAAAEQDGANPTQVLSEWVQRTMDAGLQRGLGLCIQEFMTRAQMLASTDAAFATQFQELAEKGQEAVQQAVMRAAGGGM